MTSILLTLTAVVITASAAPTAEAYYDKATDEKQNIIMVDKKVAEPGSVSKDKGGAKNGTYRENLSISDAKFAPAQEVYFKISVENTGTEDLRDITVTEHIPAYLNPQVGPGTYDEGAHTITYTIAELKAGETNTKYFKMQVDPQNKLPGDQAVIKQVNKVTVQNENASDTDSAQFYIEHEVLGVIDGITEVPRTGPMLGLGMFALGAAGLAAGLKLRRMA